MVASPDAWQRDLDMDEEAGLAARRAPGDSFRGFGKSGDGDEGEEDDEAWMVPSPEGGGHERCVVFRRLTCFQVLKRVFEPTRDELGSLCPKLYLLAPRGLHT